MAKLINSGTLKQPLEMIIKARNLIDDEKLSELTVLSQNENIPLHDLLIKRVGLPEADVYSALAESFGYQFVKVKNPVSDDSLPERIISICERENLIVTSIDEKRIFVATVKPERIKNIEPLFAGLGFEATFQITSPSFMVGREKKPKQEEVHDDLYSGVSELAMSLKDEQADLENTSDLKDISLDADSSSVIELVNKILVLAVRQSASDIHVETTNDGARVRFRIDGVLSDRIELDEKTAAIFTSRLLIMSKLDITEKVMPQDGSFKVLCDGRDVEFRFASMPGIYGQNIVLRLLSGASGKVGLETLGLLDDELEIIRFTTKYPHGMVLVAGPTGSGKSTTLYGVLEELTNPEVKLISIEDPVERRIAGVQQIQVRINRNEPDRSLTFGRGLRTILRLDPDVIMVGEIRDADTAKISMQASLTGHLVLSTIHANSSVETLRRLENIGIDFHLLMSVLNLVFSQRLVRKLCNNCKVSRPLSEIEQKLIADEHATETFDKNGCPKCFNTGYRGRIGIFEFLPIDDKIRDIIALSGLTENISEIRNARIRTLLKSALHRVAIGETDFDELERVCGPCR